MHLESIEIINPRFKRGGFKHAVLDFDGTISLIREGWQPIMIDYFTDELRAAPGAHRHDEAVLRRTVRDLVAQNTGKQTIYQCLALADEIKRLGGTPHEAQHYKDVYHERLLEKIEHRRAGLQDGSIQPEEYLVPGSIALLDMLKKHGVSLYLASGTDDAYVQQEAKMLRVDGYFDSVDGARDDYKTFSKKKVIEGIIATHQLRGDALLGLGDGYVEIENIKEVGGFACGVASNEAERCGVDEWKRRRLTDAGADIIIADYRHINELEAYLFP